MAPTCFGLRPSSGSLQLSLAKLISILKHSVWLRYNLLCDGVAACPSMACVLCAVQSTAHNTAPHNKLRRNLTECFNIDITFARLNCSLPDGRRPKHVGAI